jgi:prepilin-type N-terminal cleavage/methylation domain-containing protein/prepilin-type processing-associated H-X9-DG protein
MSLGLKLTDGDAQFRRMVQVQGQRMKLFSGNLSGRVHAGFTLIELLMVLAMIALLAALLLPGLARAKQKASQASCLDNLKQFGLALQLYSDENDGFYPPNPDDGNSIPGHNWCPGEAGAGDQAEFNPDLLQDDQICLVAPYLGEEKNLWRCPSDLRSGTYTGSNTNLTGMIIPAARTYSMNQAVGTICPGYDQDAGHSGAPTLSVNAPWLDGRETHRRNQPYQTYGKATSYTTLGPADVWTFVEEDCQGQNDAAFAVSLALPQWVDWPATYHNMSCNFTFADGHCERHKWVDSSTQAPIHGGRKAVAGDQTDWRWLAARTSTR